MNQEIKAKWVAALRSGEYEQGRNYLKGAEGYCCLGVLCDLYAKETGDGGFVEEGNNIFVFRSGVCTGEISYPPSVVQLWAGLNGCNPRLIKGSNLSGLNDQGVPFYEIADLIEKEL